MKNEVVRLNVNVPVALVEKLDTYAESMNINRTAALSVILSTYFRQDEAAAAIAEVLAMSKNEKKK